MLQSNSNVNKKGLVKNLAKAVGSEDVLVSLTDLIAYSYDATGKRSLPDVVVFPESTNEVSAIMKIACRERIPVIARGAGTNLSGGTLPSQGGIVLELSRLNRILEINVARHRAVVEPGVVNLDLQNALKPLGFMYAPDPASQKVCTLGGNMAEDAGGPHCLKYGVTSNHIRCIEMVLFDGSVVEVGAATDDSYGYDLVGPVVGSEGTLGIATKLVVRIMRLPESFQTMLAIFENLEDAGQAVSNIIAAGIVPGALEVMDNPVIRAVEASVHAGYPLDAEALLLIELDGLKGGLEQQAKQVAGICRADKAVEVKLARTAEESDLLWAGRRGAFGAVSRVRPAYSCQDATVPRNKLVPMIHMVRKIAEKYQLLIGNVFHAGDGNFHPLIMFDNRDPEETQRVEKAGREILAACLPLGGTISGEHGIGLEKQDTMPLMFSSSELELMHRVKKVFDPEDVLNPGKILPKGMAVPAEIGDTAITLAPVPEKKQTLCDELVSTLGVDNVMAEPQKLAAYQIDGRLPSLVVLPSHTDDICQVLKAANRVGMAIVPWGNGSKQAMGLPLAETGIVISLKHMNRLLELDAPNLTVRVEAGINHAELQKELARHGLYFPLDPKDMELATIGGSLAANSSGPTRLAHGTARDLVLGVTVVTPLGDVIRAGGKTMKNVAGYDMRKLFLGAWGTLGIITEATLRLFYLPEEHKTMVLKFGDIADVCRVVESVSNSFLHPESLELINARASHSLGMATDFGMQKDELLLLVGIAGNKDVVERHVSEIRVMAEASNVRELSELSGSEEKKAWASQRQIRLYSAAGTVTGKAVVPIDKTGDMFQEIQKAANKHQLEVGITGHVGNGILYPSFFPGEHSETAKEILAAISDLTHSARKMGGFLLVESGPAGVRQAYDPVSQRSDYVLMKCLKQTFDPKNILNPGKVVGTI